MLSLGSLALPGVLKGMKMQPLAKQLFTASVNAQDRVLVLIRLGGGNDGLNTVIPIDQYANLTIQRPEVLLPQSSILPLTPQTGLHPAMTGMQSLYNAGKLSVVQNVGYPNQNRSHFRSTDIWSTGMMSQSATTGWLGRYLDTEFPNYPANYPDATNPDPFAITMGQEISPTCQGLMGNFSQSVIDPFSSFNLSQSVVLNDGTYFGSHMEFLSLLIDQTNLYGTQILNAATSGNTLSTLYDLNNPLAVQLRYIAQMISGGLQTKVYIVNLNGFDTHDNQVDTNDHTIGEHADLLKKLSDAITAFQDDLQLLGIDRRVAGMTYSEFGREVSSNLSNGTDHGDAAPLFLFGTCITSNILGPNPVISSVIQNQTAVPMQIDFRDIYASVLKDWFEADVNVIQSMFEQTVTFYPILGGCVTTDTQVTDPSGNSVVLVYPNPCVDSITIRFNSKQEWVRIELHDTSGRLVQVLLDGNQAEGIHNVPVDVTRLAVGNYVVAVRKDSGELRTKLIRVDTI